MTTNGCLFTASEPRRATPSPPVTPRPTQEVKPSPTAEQAPAAAQTVYVPGEPLLLTEREAAKALAVSPRKLWDLRTRGAIPCVRFGRSVRYDPADLQAWINRSKDSA